MKLPFVKSTLLGFLCIMCTLPITAQTISHTRQACVGTGSGCTNGSVANTYNFALTGLADSSSFYTYFWDFKDGTFSTDSMPRHTFRTPGNYQVDVYITRIAGNGYDDDPPPKGFAIDTAIVIGPDDISELDLPDQPYLGYTGMMDLHESQRPVTRENDPGDTVTYVVRLRSLCPVTKTAIELDSLYFEYNPRTFIRANTFTAEYGSVALGPPVTRVKGSGSNRKQLLVWDVSAIGATDSIAVFVDLQVKSGLEVGDPVGINAYVTKDDGTPVTAQDCESSPSVSAVEDVAFSHDPNIDVVSQELICPGFIPESLDYTIHFQNTGVASAQRVEITVWFDDHMDLNQLDVLNAELGYQSYNAAQINVEVFSGYAVWTFEGTNLLLGAAHPRLHPTQYPYTKGFITFKVGFDRDPLPCSAIFNRASIVFDCNTPVHTTPSIVRVGCDTLEDCTDCPEVRFTAKETIPAEFSAFPHVDTHRFPTLRDNKAPGFLVVGRKLLYANGNEACLRTILDVGVQDCIVNIEDRTLPVDLCGGNGMIKLHATNGEAPYRWQDCRFTGTGADFEMEYPPGNYSLTVVDGNGCIGSVDFTVPSPGGIHFALDLAPPNGNIVIAGGTAPYSVEINSNPLPPDTYNFSGLGIPLPV
jgi:hypothetical protein